MDWSTALSVAGTVAMMTVPGLRTFVHESQRSAVVNELQLEIRKAASTADQLGHTVTLCAARADRDGCGADGDWSRGWIAFVDLDGDGEMSPRESSRRLWQTTNGNANIAVTARPAVFSFRPFYQRPSVASTAGALAVCDRDGHGGARRIEVRRGGVPQLADAVAGECA